MGKGGRFLAFPFLSDSLIVAKPYLKTARKRRTTEAIQKPLLAARSHSANHKAPLPAPSHGIVQSQPPHGYLGGESSGLGGVFGRLSDAFGLGRDAAGQAESRRSWGTPGHTEVRVAACLLLFLWGHCKVPPTALRWWRAGLSFQHALRNNHWF